MKGKFVEPQEVAPQCYNGVDYSATGRVLVRSKGALLVWRNGGSVWAGVGMERSYTSVHLHVVGTRDAESYAKIKSVDIFRGGRFRLDRVAAEMKKIREAMDLPGLDTKNIDFKKTFVVEES